MASFNHNKKRNTGLIYEFIVRRLALQLLNNDKQGYAKLLEIVKKYYSAGTCLAKEKELFNVIRETRNVTQIAARKILEQVKKHAQTLDRKKIEIKKSNLIKEINHSFGKDFYSTHRIQEYRLLASIQMLFDSCNSALNEAIKNIQLEEAIVHFMTTSNDVKKQTPIEEHVDNLVATFVAKKFGEKYCNVLNVEQKKLLENYVKMTMANDFVGFEKFLIDEKTKLLNKLVANKNMHEIKEDLVMKQRLGEAINKLRNLSTESSNDSVVEEIMLFYKLAEEMSSNE